jgi:hypothetical protein
MIGHVKTNSIKNDIAVLVSLKDNLCRATIRLSVDKKGKFSNYPLMKDKIFILSYNSEIRKYEVQQVDIGILLLLSIWVHLVIIAAYYT